MQLMFLGAGAAFGTSPDNFQSNMVLTSPSGRRLLIDCGSDIRFSLAAAGLSRRDITDIYVSHLHADHVGGLEYMGFSSRFGDGPFPITLYASETIVGDLWTHSLSGGMRTIQEKNCTLSDYFDPRPVPPTGRFLWEDVEFQLVPVPHVVGQDDTMYSYGLFFSLEGTSIYLTTDATFAVDQMGAYLTRADLIFHDCETSPHQTGVHAHYTQLVTLPPNIKSKTWLYHYDDGNRPDARADGFLGYVQRGQIFNF